MGTLGDEYVYELGTPTLACPQLYTTGRWTTQLWPLFFPLQFSLLVPRPLCPAAVAITTRDHGVDRFDDFANPTNERPGSRRFDPEIDLGNPGILITPPRFGATDAAIGR